MVPHNGTMHIVDPVSCNFTHIPIHVFVIIAQTSPQMSLCNFFHWCSSWGCLALQHSTTYIFQDHQIGITQEVFILRTWGKDHFPSEHIHWNVRIHFHCVGAGICCVGLDQDWLTQEVFILSLLPNLHNYLSRTDHPHHHVKSYKQTCIEFD